MRKVKKSRNGCARCKHQRVKCDEQAPSCGRCTRVGVKCPGIGKLALRWSTKHELPCLGDSSREIESSMDDVSLSYISIDSTRAARGSTNTILHHFQSPKREKLGLKSNTYESTRYFQPQTDSHIDQSFEDFFDTMSTPSWDATALQHPRISPMYAGEKFYRGSSEPMSTTPVESKLKYFDFDNFPQSYTQPSLDPFFESPPSLPSISTIVSTPTRGLNDTTTVLVEYYFKEVAGLFSCYDSAMNPFRTTVNQLWNYSPAIYFSLQSMAAACLATDFPHLSREGLRLREEAVAVLKKESKLDDKSLLALLMLGQTASWHDHKDLGITYFNQARKCLRSIVTEPSIMPRKNNTRFFQEALIYWEMLLSYVTDEELFQDETINQIGMASRPAPHPWTGFSRDAQTIVREVGILVRKERSRIRKRRFSSQADIDQAKVSINTASALEAKLWRLSHPSEPDVISPDDENTPVWHLLTVAEIFRRVGLIQIYRAFPDILNARLQRGVDSLYPMNIVVGSSELFTTTRSQREWLTNFALDTARLLKEIPGESRTRSLQPFLLVACGCELNYSSAPKASPNLGQGSELSLQTLEISLMRKFILGRLTAFLHVLPAKPVQVCLDLVRGCWTKTDAGEDVYWVDVMIENGWETTMG